MSPLYCKEENEMEENEKGLMFSTRDKVIKVINDLTNYSQEKKAVYKETIERTNKLFPELKKNVIVKTVLDMEKQGLLQIKKTCFFRKKITTTDEFVKVSSELFDNV